jgi:PAS domain S-box-containing protein
VQELKLVLEELRAADEELRAQNAELEMALHCAQDEHCRAYELFEFAPIALLHTDAAGVLREANRKAERLIGCARQHMLELPLVMFIAPQAKRQFRERMRRALAEHTAHTWDSIIGRGSVGAEGADGETVVIPAAAVPGATTPRAVIITAEAERRRGENGRPEPATLIRWAIQDIHELVMARSGPADASGPDLRRP